MKVIEYNTLCCEGNLQRDVRLAQLDRAFGYGPKGREFESSSARYEKKAFHYGVPFLFYFFLF